MDQDSKVNRSVALPWQFSTIGLVLGFFIGVIPFIIALMGNYQFKSGHDTSDLKLIYNICLIIIGIIYIILFLLIIFAFFVSLAFIV